MPKGDAPETPEKLSKAPPPSGAGPFAAPLKATSDKAASDKAASDKTGALRRVVLPPGYDAQAAKSTLKRYPKQAAAAVRSIAGAPRPLTASASWMGKSFDEQLERMRAVPLAAMWLGHATVLLRLDGRWVLTDPVLSETIGVRLGLGKLAATIGPRRLLPAIAPARLPTPDLILLSHAHFDHLDKPTLRALASKHTQIVTARGTKGLVPRGFGSVQELAWENDLEVAGLRLTALRPAHWGARTMWDRHRGFNSYVLGDVHNVLYAGDSANTTAFNRAASLVPSSLLHLSIFGIGAYDPWIAAHANPEQVWQMHAATGAAHLLPMHHSTFVLSDEPLDEPLARLLQAAGDNASRVVGTTLGEAWMNE